MPALLTSWRCQNPKCDKLMTAPLPVKPEALRPGDDPSRVSNPKCPDCGTVMMPRSQSSH